MPTPLPQPAHPAAPPRALPEPFKKQLLKWVGNKQKFAHEIIRHFPADVGTYREPFLGSGAVMATLSPERAVGSDIFPPLMEIWATLAAHPERLKDWYNERHAAFHSGDRTAQYEALKARYNSAPNGADFLFLSRACYGGVVRFRKKDGYMSTPCGAHPPMKPASFARRVDMWHHRLRGASFECLDYRDAMAQAQPGDLVYCDPPYSDSQTILYGAQTFRLNDLFDAILACKSRGVHVALSINGSKKSGNHRSDLVTPSGLFEQEVPVNMGQSLLRCFQTSGARLSQEYVQDRLLLTY